ncbi:PH domain-containing protein [Solirubrobacter soli]|uniref:PH domain-containing protein n=1 Tax=Solirubrobacter soli TaxID=363832 RepID=UPI000416916C|nr:PH domain-containing protein [Solirubrobacter soli]
MSPPTPEERSLHPSAIVIFSTDAFKNLAVPLLVLLGVTLFGGSLDVDALRRAAIYGIAGLIYAAVVGSIRYRSTSYFIGPEAIHYVSGMLSKKVTDIRLDRIQAIDVHQGVLQRAFGVFSVDVQTGAGKKGGEISLPALTPGAVEELRAARPGVTPRVDAPPGPSRRLEGRDLAFAALTAGQLGIVVPVLAAAFQVVQQLFDERQGEEAVRALPHSTMVIVLAIAGLIVLAWMLSIAGAVLAFGGFTVTRDGDRLRIRRGVVQRSEATVPVGRVRAVRVVEGIFRRPFGLAALTVEVTGYADEAAAARTLFPLVRVRDVRAFLEEFLPELADDPHGLTPPPRRAARRYLMLPLLAGVVVTVAAWFLVGPPALVALVLAGAYAHARWRAAAWRLADGRLAVRSMRLARTTILAPARYRESHTLAQNLFQRRADLADLEVAFGKQTTARIRHLEAADARAAWTAL